MRRFRSLLIDEANIRIPGLTIMTFALHRHLPEHASIEPHRHGFCQALLYVGSKGRQTLDGAEVVVEPGTLILMPPNVSHAFHRSDRRTPLCLMINFRITGARRQRAAVCSLNRSALAEIRHHLARLIRLRAAAGKALHWDGAVIVLQTLLLFLRTAGWLESPAGASAVAGSRAIRGLLDKVALLEPLAGIVQRSGYQRDHLNRLVKTETGLTLGQWRAQRRLIKAKELLTEGVSVAAIAAEVGLPDQGYFARWFRRQTGQSPSGWRMTRLRLVE